MNIKIASELLYFKIRYIISVLKLMGREMVKIYI